MLTPYTTEVSLEISFELYIESEVPRYSSRFAYTLLALLKYLRQKQQRQRQQKQKQKQKQNKTKQKHTDGAFECIFF